MVIYSFVALCLQSNSLSVDLLPSGSFSRIGGYAPIGIKLSEKRPEFIKKTPDLVAPKYGFVEFAGQKFAVVLDKDRLYVDSNSDGDLTNDPATVWKEKTFNRYGIEKKEWDGFATINLPYGGKTVPCRIGIYEMEDSGQMGCYVDFALVGQITLGNDTYPLTISDPTGDFTSNNPRSILMIDRERNGKYNPGYEFFPMSKPFNIGGISYLVKGSAPNFLIDRSPLSVPERTKLSVPSPDPNSANGLRSGVLAPKFEATSMSGKKIVFPSSFSGKIVMIDFWATWCGPCMREAPNVVKAFGKFHKMGFEVLGVSLDQANSVKTIQTVTSKVGMDWEQIYDGKYWQGAIPSQYQIKAIPATYLVDGSTGKIIASGDSLRGDRLENTISNALAVSKSQRP